MSMLEETANTPAAVNLTGMENFIEVKATIKKLQKNNRILQKKFDRSEADRIRLEEVNRKKESLLKQVIVELQDSQSILEKKSSALEEAILSLQQTQAQLVESEKLAALGRLVAGVAHEINTPVGTGITLASVLADETQHFQMLIAQGQIKRSVINHYTEVATESSRLILTNLNRAAELIRSFKRVSVDQTHAEKRIFDVKIYLEEVMMSLSPQLRKHTHRWQITGDDSIVINSNPGAFAQIVTNLVTNSLNHGYGNNDSGELRIHLCKEGDSLSLSYSDDGRGIPLEHQGQVFEPFFTTARQHGGTGLGLSIIYNLVCQKLQGSITLDSQPGKGVQFLIQIPCGDGV